MDVNDLARAEKLGVEGVLLEIAKGGWGQSGSPIRVEVEHWIKLKEAERTLVASSKRDAREEETLSIARQARADARSANRIAIIAMIFSFITAAIIAWYTVKYGK